MPWPKQQEAKDIIGMEPTELKEKLDKVGEIETVKSDVSDVKAMLTSVKAALDSITTTRQSQEAQHQQSQQQEPTSFLDDPDRAMNERMRPLVNMELDTRAMIEFDRASRLRVKDSDGRLVSKFPYWDAFSEEIKTIINAQPPQARCNPAIIENAYKIVLGNHVEDIANDRVKGTGAFVLESAGSVGISAGSKKEPGVEITDTDRKQAAKFNIPIDKYMASKKELNYVGG